MQLDHKTGKPSVKSETKQVNRRMKQLKLPEAMGRAHQNYKSTLQAASAATLESKSHQVIAQQIICSIYSSESFREIMQKRLEHTPQGKHPLVLYTHGN